MEKISSIKKVNLTEQVVYEIKKYISSNKLKKDEKLPSERELSAMLSVSRNMVRECLSYLASSGIIYKVQGKGVFVGAFKEENFLKDMMFGTEDEKENVIESIEIRKAFEIAVLKILIKKITDPDIIKLRNKVKFAEKYTKLNNLVEEDIEFHKLLLSMLKNPQIERIGNIINEFFKLTQKYYRMNDNDVPAIKKDLIKYHNLIVDALESKDQKKCIEAINKQYEGKYFIISD